MYNKSDAYYSKASSQGKFIPLDHVAESKGAYGKRYLNNERKSSSVDRENKGKLN